MTIVNRLNLLSDVDGLRTAQRAIVTEDESITRQHPSLMFAMLLPWIAGMTGYDLLARAESTLHRQYTPSTGFNLALRFLEILSRIERKGMAHADLCPGNMFLDPNTCDIQLIDLEGMYLPGKPEPIAKTQGTPGYQQQKGAPTWRPDGDRYAAAILAAELILLGFDEATALINSDGVFRGNCKSAAACERFARAEQLIKQYFPAFAKVLRTTWLAPDLPSCSTIPELLDALRYDQNASVLSRDGAPTSPASGSGIDTIPMPASVFVSYAHQDSLFKNELAKHLQTLERTKIIEAWDDQEIPAGDEWDAQIDKHLRAAHIIVLLVSADFLSSHYCYSKELRCAIERHNAKEARLIPVVVRDVDFQDSPIEKLNPLPKRNGKPHAVSHWTKRDHAWLQVILAIRQALTR